MYVPMDLFLVEVVLNCTFFERGGPECHDFECRASFLRFYINNYDRVTRKDRSFGIMFNNLLLAK